MTIQVRISRGQPPLYTTFTSTARCARPKPSYLNKSRSSEEVFIIHLWIAHTGPTAVMVKSYNRQLGDARPFVSASNYIEAPKAPKLASPHKDDAGLPSGRDDRRSDYQVGVDRSLFSPRMWDLSQHACGYTYPSVPPTARR